MSESRKTIATAILALVAWTCFSSVAAPPAASPQEWLPLTNNSDGTKAYSAKSGSYSLMTTKDGTSVAMVLGQTENKKDNTFTYNKWYVSTSDCDAGMGKIVVLKVNGDFDFEADFVSHGNNVGSGIADLICDVYRSDQKKRQGKGI